MGPISPEGENLLDFLELRQVLSTYDGDLWDTLWWPQERPVPMEGGTWKAVVHGVAEGRTRLSNFTLTFHFQALEKEMAPHSSVLAWRIPGMAGAWWAAVYGVAQSQTRLKRLSSSSSMDCMVHGLLQARKLEWVAVPFSRGSS